MKPLGWAVAVCGVIYMIIAFNMDVSVSTQPVYVPGYGAYGGGDVANIDLMSRRQNHVIIASVITLVGVLMGIFGRFAGATSQSSPPSETARRGPFQGERNIAHDPYRLWLASEYDIRRNDVFDRFVIGDLTFETLDAALSHANNLENEKQAKAEAAKQEQERAEEARRAAAENARLESEAEWQRSEPKFIASMAALAVIAGLFAYFGISKSRETAAQALVQKRSQLAAFESRYGIRFPAEDVEQIGAIGPYQEFLCANKKHGTLVTFAPTAQATRVLSTLDKALGDHEIVYQFEDSGEWRWAKSDRLYVFHTIGSAGYTKKLCITHPTE